MGNQVDEQRFSPEQLQALVKAAILPDLQVTSNCMHFEWGFQAAASGQERLNPHKERACALAWRLGYDFGLKYKKTALERGTP